MPARLEAQREGIPGGRWKVMEGCAVVLGRGAEADWRFEGEPYLSRRHVELRLEEGRLRVKRLAQAGNPVFHGGEQQDEFWLAAGESFVIGATRFLLLAEAEPEAGPAEEHVMPAAEVYAVSDRMRLRDLLELPEILRGRPRQESYSHIAGILRLATGAQWAVVASGAGEPSRILGRDAARDDAAIRLSGRLVAAAVKALPQPVFHSWRSSAAELQATVCEGTDWAVCAAASVPGAEPVLFYVAGSGGQASAAAPVNLDNTRYVGLVADMVGRSLSVQRLEEWETRLERFFSRRVVERILAGRNFQELEPQVAQSTILFFDIRGFSRLSEGSQDRILELQRRLRLVMTAMTDEILKEEGVVLQYMGDGILACWNVPCADAAHVDRACRAALGMVRRLAEVEPGMRCGIGIHTGQVVAGTIGSEQLFSYGVVGPVINQTSRIEGITKFLEAPVLATKAVAERLSPRGGVAAVPMGTFRPEGMGVDLELYELTPAPAEPQRLQAFSVATAALAAGDWDAVGAALHPLPLGDRPARHLEHLAEGYRRQPPASWRGVVELSEK